MFFLVSFGYEDIKEKKHIYIHDDLEPGMWVKVYIIACAAHLFE